jgi:hypothetical protein
MGKNQKSVAVAVVAQVQFLDAGCPTLKLNNIALLPGDEALINCGVVGRR